MSDTRVNENDIKDDLDDINDDLDDLDFDDDDDDDDENDLVVWEEPPTLRRGRKQVDGANVAIAKALKEKEGEWAKIAENSRDSSLVSKIKKGGHRAYEPSGSFEATSRRDKEGNITVWARYIGLDHLNDEDDLEDTDDSVGDVDEIDGVPED